MINKVENLTINDVRKNMINKVANLTINDAKNNSNRATASDSQFQFAGDSAGISHKNLLSEPMIGIRHEEVAVLVPPIEPSFILNIQPSITVRNRFIQAP